MVRARVGFGDEVAILAPSETQACQVKQIVYDRGARVMNHQHSMLPRMCMKWRKSRAMCQGGSNIYCDLRRTATFTDILSSTYGESFKVQFVSS